MTDLSQIEAAVGCFFKAVDLKPDDAVAYNNLGSTLKQRERFQEAIESYSRSVNAVLKCREFFSFLSIKQNREDLLQCFD